MKYTLLTAAALATVAIAAPAPDKAISLGDLGLGGGDDNKATVSGNTLTLSFDIHPLLALLENTYSGQVTTKSKVKAKRGHHQGAQLVSTVKDLVSKVQTHIDDVGR